MAPDDQPRLDPHIAEAVRDAYLRPIDGATARQHLNAIVAAAGEPVTRHRRRPWRALVAATAAAFALPAGLAFAGVSLPAAVERPYRAIGIGLPHQEERPAPAARPSPPSATVPPAPTATPEKAASGERKPSTAARRDGGNPGRGHRGRHSGRGNSGRGNAGRGNSGGGNPGRGSAGGASTGRGGAARSGNSRGGAARSGNSSGGAARSGNSRGGTARGNSAGRGAAKPGRSKPTPAIAAPTPRRGKR